MIITIYKKKCEAIVLELTLSRKIYLLLAVFAIVAVFFLIALKYEDNYHEDFTIEQNEDGTTASITGFSGNPRKLEIPAEIDGYKITSISKSAFTGLEKLRTLKIDGNVESIGEYAFADCTSLKKVTLNEGLKVIGLYAFSGCTSLKSINLPDTLEVIDDFAFSLCSRLERVKIPASCTTIGKDAFAACESLVMDCSENELALQVAEDYNIPKTFDESFDYLMVKVALITLALGAVVIAAFIIVPKIIRRKSKKLPE